MQIKNITYVVVPDPRFDELVTLIQALRQEMKDFRKEMTIMASNITDEIALLVTAVSEEKTVEDGMVTLLDGVNAQLTALIAADSVTPAALQSVVDTINTNKAKMADAVARNTAAAPVPDPTPAPVPDPTQAP